MTDNRNNATYKDSGVDIEAGEHAVDLIKQMARSTFSPNVISDIGGFGGLFSLKGLVGQDPVLVSGTDGVGTKLKLAFLSGRHDTVGIDAVAMCVNDVLCTGAKPLFFLDYLAVGRLDPAHVRDIISGIAEGCRQGECALIGGEMAEMPGFYADGEYDIAGFCVGIVDRSAIVDGSKIRKGDLLLGIPSSGLHSNGFSLVRNVVFNIMGLDPAREVDELGGLPVARALLEPTLIYTKEVLAMVGSGLTRGIAHITGGGLEDNVTRIIPGNMGVEIDWTAWERPAVFNFLQRGGSIEEQEMRRVFNCGIGMVFAVSPDDADTAAMALEKAGARGCLRIGRVV